MFANIISYYFSNMTYCGLIRIDSYSIIDTLMTLSEQSMQNIKILIQYL